MDRQHVPVLHSQHRSRTDPGTDHLVWGHVSDISVPQYVSTGDSAPYNAMALPILMQEAMAAHDTAVVANVSGASLTSEAFTKSLQSALINAGFKF